MKKYLLSLILLIPLLTSCNDWLDITAKGEVQEEDLLSGLDGYNAALAGAYFELTDPQLFGSKLSCGELDLMAQYWVTKQESLIELGSLNHKHPSSEASINSMWSALYGLVGTSNLIINSIEKNGESIGFADLIEGEAVGLRAFAHFELFRLFGPVLLEDKDFEKKCIIYREKFDKKYLNFSTTKEVLGYIKRDLLRAKELLSNDPIRINGGRSDDNPSILHYNDILYYRVSRMNYYAVVGLLIRLEMYMKNEEQAYMYITELLEEIENKKDVSGFIKFVNKERLNNSLAGANAVDIPFSSEFLFSIYYNDLHEKAKQLFGNQGLGSGTFAVDYDSFSNLTKYVYAGVPNGSLSDLRLKHWFKTDGLTNYIYEINKFLPAKSFVVVENGVSKEKDAYQQEIGYITLGEIYLSAFECQIGKNNKLALSYLNTLRVARDLEELDVNKNYTNEELLDQLIIESKKEYLASGRMFHLLKRLYRPMPRQNGTVIEASREIYELPVPSEEIEYSKNNE